RSGNGGLHDTDTQGAGRGQDSREGTGGKLSGGRLQRRGAGRVSADPTGSAACLARRAFIRSDRRRAVGRNRTQRNRRTLCHSWLLLICTAGSKRIGIF